MVQLHTIISREVIKPASPAPSHPHTYNLSEIDLIANKAYMPLLLLYPNNGSCSLTAQDKATLLKKSLSQSLTKYYHFSGRLSTRTAPYIDCNDEGVVFLEARNDSKLDIIAQDGIDIDQLFPDDMVFHNSPNNANLVGVQVNHFACGGLGVAVSMSHLVGDGCTLGSFISHWASVARYGSTEHKEVLPLNPYFMQLPRTNSLLLEPPVVTNQQNSNRVMRKFVFPNSKLSDLKKVVASAEVNNPTRVEALTSLLYKTTVAAATARYGCFEPSYLLIAVDIRNKFVEKLPQTAVGNLASLMMVPTMHTSETSLSKLVAEIRKHKLQMEGIESVQQAAEGLKSLLSKLVSEDLGKRLYMCSSICGFPFNKVDFGWGKPMATKFALETADRNGFLLTDSPNIDGIEAQVILEKEEMEIIQNDKELLSFCQVN